MTERGWYLDPQGDGERWHDGVRWTGVTRPTAESEARLAAAEAAVERRDRRDRRGHRLRYVAVMAVMLLLAGGLTLLLAPGQVKPIAEAFGIGRPHRLLAAVSPTVRSSDYKIMLRDFEGDPVTYDPCQPVRYVINPAGAPADYQSFLRPAVAKAQAATGLKFVYDGVSTDTWAAHDHASKAEPVLITFADALDGGTASRDAVGIGGSTSVKINGRTQPHFITGQVELLSTWFARESEVHATAAEESVVMHELGHVLGLGHVHGRDEVMYPLAHGQTHYGPGDLAGLATLGSGACSG